MNKIKLLKEMRALYGTNCTTEIVKANLDAYNKLIKGSLNYDKLYELIISKWKYSNYMPTPGFIQEQIFESIIKIHVKEHKEYEYKCIILEDSEKLKIKEGQIYYGGKEEVIFFHKNGVKLKISNVRVV